MKKVCLFWLLMAALITVIPVYATQEQPTINENVSCYSLDALNTVLTKEELIDNADSIIVYEVSSDTLMYAWNADEQAYPASLVKIMSGLIVAEEGNMDEAVTVKESVLSEIPSDAATTGLQPDEVISVKDLYYCMMVSSANDAAAVLADHIYGSQEAFIKRMNEYAAELGCTGTNFVNVHGLHNEQQYTTVRDMGKILVAALENEIFAEAFGTEKYTVNPTNKSPVRYLVTGNYLMSMDDVEYYYDSRVTGGRTGVTTEGYRNIAVSAKSGSMELLCILTGAESTLADNGRVDVFGGYTETSDLLDMCFDNYQVAQVIYDEQVLTQMPVTKGECDVVLGPNSNVLAVLPNDAKTTDLTYRYPAGSMDLTAPIKKGDQISSVEVWYKTMCVAQSDLYAMNAVEQEQIESVKLESAAPEKNATALWIILGVIGGVVLILLVTRAVSSSRHKASVRRSRHRRRNRKRSR